MSPLKLFSRGGDSTSGGVSYERLYHMKELKVVEELTDTNHVLQMWGSDDSGAAWKLPVEGAAGSWPTSAKSQTSRPIHLPFNLYMLSIHFHGFGTWYLHGIYLTTIRNTAYNLVVKSQNLPSVIYTVQAATVLHTFFNEITFGV